MQLYSPVLLFAIGAGFQVLTRLADRNVTGLLCLVEKVGISCLLHWVYLPERLASSDVLCVKINSARY